MVGLNPIISIITNSNKYDLNIPIKRESKKKPTSNITFVKDLMLCSCRVFIRK